MITHKKIVKRPCGGRARIDVWFSENYRAGEFKTQVYLCEKGKRTFIPTTNTDDYRFRSLSMDERANKNINDQMDAVGSEALLAAKLELWESIKPT